MREIKKIVCNWQVNEKLLFSYLFLYATIEMSFSSFESQCSKTLVLKLQWRRLILPITYKKKKSLPVLRYGVLTDFVPSLLVCKKHTHTMNN